MIYNGLAEALTNIESASNETELREAHTRLDEVLKHTLETPAKEIKELFAESNPDLTIAEIEDMQAMVRESFELNGDLV